MFTYSAKVQYCQRGAKVDDQFEAKYDKIIHLKTKLESMSNGRFVVYGSPIITLKYHQEKRDPYTENYRAGPIARRLDDAEKDMRLKIVAFDPLETEWATPILLPSRMQELMRFCVFYRKLNDVCAKSYSIREWMDASNT